MTELTKEQLSLATESYYGALHGIDPARYSASSLEKGLKAAAPFLQMPWSEPSRDELLSIGGTIRQLVPSELDRIAKAIKLFVQFRNIALLPKPVDPRREKIVEAIRSYGYVGDKAALANSIIAALDEVK